MMPASASKDISEAAAKSNDQPGLGPRAEGLRLKGLGLRFRL